MTNSHLEDDMKLITPTDAIIESSDPVKVFYEPAQVLGGKKPVTISHDPGSGSEFPVGVTPVNIEATDANGKTMPGGFIIRVIPPVVGNPIIDSIIPATGEVGSNLGINGLNFGIQQSNNFVTLNGVVATVISWSNTFISVVVPNTTTGDVIVTVNGIPSNAILFTIQVINPPVVDIITPNQLPGGQVGVQTQVQFQASGGTPPYTFTPEDPSELPDGVTLAADGTYTGTPTVETTAIFNVNVSDSLGNGGTEQFTQVIGPAVVFPLEILTQSVPSGAIGAFYSHTLQGSGGVPPYNWFVFSGNLPPGLALAGDTIQGTPTSNGVFNFQIRLRDSVGTEVFRGYQIVVAGSLIITNASPLPTASLGSPYSVQFFAANGTAPYVFARINGIFPVGLSLAGGVLSGTPTVSQTTNFTIRVTDDTGDTFDKQFELSVSQIAPSAYYDELRVLPVALLSHSLRTQAELDDLVNARPSTFFSYIFGSDTYPNAQDAAKLVIPVSRSDIPGNQQLRIVFPQQFHTSQNRILITWDFWWGPEWRDNLIIENMNAMKAFRIQAFPGGGTNFGYPKVHFTGQNNPQGDGAGPLSVGFANATFTGVRDASGNPIPRPNGYITGDPIDPSGFNSHVQGQRQPASERYHYHHSTWTRYWTELRLGQPRTAFSEWESAYSVMLDPSRDYTMISLWSADQARNVARLIYKAPWNMAGNGYNQFHFEFDTSSPAPTYTGDIISYARNVVILLNYSSPAFDSTTPENDSFLFRKPVI